METGISAPRPTKPNGSGNAVCLICSSGLEPARVPGLVRCAVCAFVTTNLNLTDADLKKLYGYDYFHGQGYHDYLAEEESLRLNFRRRISVLQSLRPNLRSADLFEIGCAYGFFLNEVAPLVRKASGIDISADAIARAIADQKTDARVADYLSVQLPTPVDIITMWDTIEHLRRPDLFIAKTAQDLKPGGLLAITTGDIDALNARIRGKSWRMIHPPTHLHYFSVRTLSRLLERNGFEVVHVSHPGNSRKLRSMLYALTKSSISQVLNRLPVLDMGLTLNLFDIMYVVGRRTQRAAGGGRM